MTFCAENSNTGRHLAEFWMIEPEIAFADLSDNAALAEALLKYTFAGSVRGDQRQPRKVAAITRSIAGQQAATHL